MSYKLPRSIFGLVLLSALLTQPPLALACGPFSLNAVFTFTLHPDYPLENFARGEIGIVQPSFARSYLYVAYRYFSGAGFNPNEQQALVDLWRDRLDLRWQPGEDGAVNEWVSARQKVIPGAPPKIEVYRSREKPNEYDSYLNCQKDAFESATATLDARIKQFGSENSVVKQWVEAQDLVFANCSEGKHIPVALPADADAQSRADRDYQIAAANFYAGNFELAKTQFAAIAASRSTWRAIAPYLVARTLLRKASLGPPETKSADLAEAEQELNKVIRISELQPTHAAARRLLTLVRTRLHPEERLHELAVSLAGNTAQANLKQDLWDYTLLLDDLTGDDEAHHQKTRPANLQSDDLTDWITTFQSDKADAREHSLSRWRATASVPWLIAALAKVEPHHPQAVALQRAAAEIPASSAAFATAAFWNVHLDIMAGRSAEARTGLDDLLHNHRARFNHSSLNLLRQQRMLVSTSLDDFLTQAQRVPAGFSWDEDGREIPTEAAEVGEELKSLQGQPFFDVDAAEAFDKQVPLSLLGEAASSKRLPDHLRRDVTQAAWVRAVLLGNTTVATELVPHLKSQVPALNPLLDEYVSARGSEAKKFAAIYAWLKFPGLEPVVDSGVGRLGSLEQQDSYRDNWWCSAALATPTPNATDRVPAVKPAPSFLTAAQLATAQKEYSMLTALGAAPNYLCRQVLEWATKNPTDPRVPEALHLAVKTTRYGCTDKQTGTWSKAAHDFLHRRYPNNTWTKQTPYWFKE